MKITLKYEEADSKELHMLLRLTLPQKYINGPTRDVVQLFVDHYNKKHAENQLSAADLHIKIVGGEHVDHEERVKDVLSSGDECYLLGPSVTQPAAKKIAVAPKAAAAAEPKAPVKDAQGRVRCKRFGCQQMFNPDGPEQKCVYHKAPPIFHETAKWWSCCPDRKAYEFDEFMRIPGCCTGVCSANPEGQQQQKRFLGGSDLRGDSAPVRLDADAPPDPRQQLSNMMKGLVAIGVDGSLVEKVWAKLDAETNDPEKVCEIFRQRFARVLNNPDL